ncbi:MAG: hypothetical protein K5871_00120 [Lachnospiraceae bacterium]|nr:hypothetical protein [Lachnospiraceae bacterium]
MDKELECFDELKLRDDVFYSIVSEACGVNADNMVLQSIEKLWRDAVKQCSGAYVPCVSELREELCKISGIDVFGDELQIDPNLAAYDDDAWEKAANEAVLGLLEFLLMLEEPKQATIQEKCSMYFTEYLLKMKKDSVNASDYLKTFLNDENVSKIKKYFYQVCVLGAAYSRSDLFGKLNPVDDYFDKLK